MGSAGSASSRPRSREQGEVLAARTAPGWEPAARRGRGAAPRRRRLPRDRGPRHLRQRRPLRPVPARARGAAAGRARGAVAVLERRRRRCSRAARCWRSRSRAARRTSSASSRPRASAGSADDRDHQRRRLAAGGRRPTSSCRCSPGAERSVAATKTYLASLHAIAQIAACSAPGRPTARPWFERLPGARLDDGRASSSPAASRFDPLAAARRS